MNVVCVGDCGVDLYWPGRERLAGGITLNFALAARRWFHATDTIHIAAPLGADRDADLVRERVRGSGVSADFSVCQGSTPVQEIEIDKQGERHFRAYHEGVLRNYRADAALLSALADADLVVTPVFEQNREMFLSIVRCAYSATTAVDFADFAVHADLALVESVMDRVAIGFFGMSPRQTDAISQLRQIARRTQRTLVITLGAAGSLAFKGDAAHRCAACPVDTVVDTTGAGDAFAAGFLSLYGLDNSPQPALERGAMAAREALAKKGGN